MKLVSLKLSLSIFLLSLFRKRTGTYFSGGIQDGNRMCMTSVIYSFFITFKCSLAFHPSVRFFDSITNAAVPPLNTACPKRAKAVSDAVYLSTIFWDRWSRLRIKSAKSLNEMRRGKGRIYQYQVISSFLTSEK